MKVKMKQKENFTSQFYNLEGVTIGERQRNLNVLTGAIRKTFKNQSDIETFLSSLTPKTHLEILFRIKLLRCFKCYELMVDVLKTENVIYIKKVLQDRSFIDHLFESHTPESFINTFLPQVSFSTRMKLLNKFSGYNDPQKNSKLFDSCLERYGLDTALLIVHTCDSDKIKSLLNEYKIKLRPNVLLKLAEKNIDLSILYVEHHHKNFSLNVGDQRCYKAFFEFVAHRNPKAFFELQQKYRLTIKLGRKTTRCVIERIKNDVMSEPTVIINTLNMRAVSKCLGRGGVLEEFYCTLMRLKCSFTLTKLSEHLPNKTKVELYLNALQKIYNVSIDEHPEFIDRTFLYQIESASEREKYLKFKLNDQTDRYDWMRFYNVDTAVKYYKEKLQLTADYTQRAKILDDMMEACYINNDKEKLLDVCKYVTQRHRNDDVAFRNRFLHKFATFEGDFSAEKLSAGHWDCIKEFLIIADLNKENVCFKLELLIKYIKWHFLNGAKLDDLLLSLLKEFPSMDFNICEDIPKLEKICLSIFYEILPKVYERNVDLIRNDVKLYWGVIRWNLKHPHSVMDVNTKFPRLTDSLKSSLSNDSLCCAESKKILTRLICTERKREFFVYYWNNYKNLRDEKVNVYFLRNDPTQICENLETYTSVDLLDRIRNKSELNFCKKLSHLGLPDVIVAKCKCYLKTNTSTVLRILAYLMPAFDFVELAKGESIKNVAPNFKYIQPASFALPEVIGYCNGKHMKSALKALYAVVYNTPEFKLPPHIERLTNRPISVRKHAIYVTHIALSTRDLHDFLKNLLEKETDITAFKYIHRTIQRLLAQTSTDDNWELFKTCTLKMDKDDQELEKLIDLNKVPSKYSVLYLEFAWNLLYDHKNRDLKFALLKSVTPKQFDSLPNNFCCVITEKYFLIEDDVNEFVVMSLFHFSSDDLYETRLNGFYEILRKQKQLAETQNVRSEVKFRKKLKTFLSSYYQYALEHCCYRYVKLFFDKWNETFKPHEFFEEYLSLQVITSYLESPSDYALFNRRMCETLHILTVNYTTAIVNIFAATLKYIFENYIYTNQDEHYETVLYDLFKNLSEMDVSSGALTVFKMIDRVPSDAALKIQYLNIISKLKERPEKDVEIYLKLHERNI